jgi:hypothetical protein
LGRKINRAAGWIETDDAKQVRKLDSGPIPAYLIGRRSSTILHRL